MRNPPVSPFYKGGAPLIPLFQRGNGRGIKKISIPSPYSSPQRGEEINLTLFLGREKGGGDGQRIELIERIEWTKLSTDVTD